jgi:superfamily II DNA or RNA helicase
VQELRRPFAAGDAVIARGERWLVEETTAFAECVVVYLTASSHARRARRRATLLYPFDRLIRDDTNRKIRVVTRAEWMRTLRGQLGTLRHHGQLRAARFALMDIHAFQLEPALALIRGRSARVLLADEVGLGKTIQAGLMLAELQQRGWCERALILCPAGLCEQWSSELRQRFALSSGVFDARVLHERSATLPLDVNPWSVESVAIASIDFIKQPEMLHGVTSVLWDMVIIDEAHQVATAPMRAAAANAVASRARHVVLVTATPHAGDEIAYRALCAIGHIAGGEIDDPLLIFRRTRRKLGLSSTRKARLLRVKSGPHEHLMHRLLARYAKRLWQIGSEEPAGAARLVAMVFSKRAMSSATSLALSVERRLAGLCTEVAALHQHGLPFPDLEDDTDAADVDPLLAAPAFETFGGEEAALRSILAAARRAGEKESKVHALMRLLRRVQEPAIVFTEYRDTLATLERALESFRKISLLHGGMSRAERRTAVDAFTSGGSDLLLATDAGSEGLNLQSRCRLVINLELPWNPIRLEQRIGRVDRIGQSRTVHAIHLYGAGTAESTVLANLVRRLDLMRATEMDIAACIIGGSDRLQQMAHSDEQTVTERSGSHLTEEAESEAARLSSLKHSAPSPASHPDHVHESVRLCHTAVASFRLRSQQKSPASTFVRPATTLWIFRLNVISGSGRLVEEILIPVQLPLTACEALGFPSCRPKRHDVRAIADLLLRHFRSASAAAAQLAGERRALAIASEGHAWVARALARERRLAQMLDTDAELVQAGLFETRSLQHRQETRLQYERILQLSASHVDRLERDTSISLAQVPDLVLLLIQC